MGLAYLDQDISEIEEDMETYERLKEKQYYCDFRYYTYHYFVKDKKIGLATKVVRENHDSTSGI